MAEKPERAGVLGELRAIVQTELLPNLRAVELDRTGTEIQPLRAVYPAAISRSTSSSR
ncbi:MAG: hypothetical protein M3P93_12240 [Actinomycetota bacterium]|nr:hypothetical protein [Actinomycetota bacterium]